MMLRRLPQPVISAHHRASRLALSNAAASKPRPFTQCHPTLLLIRSSNLRPQLPYLSQPSRGTPSALLLQRNLARLLSTETRSYVREQTWLAVKWTGVGWTMLVLLSVAYYGWQSELIERQHPSPTEWTFYTRAAFRAGHARMNPEFAGTGIVDWAQVGTEFRHCVERLESGSYDGKGLRDYAEPESKDSMTLIPGVGRAGFDVSEKSFAWRTGYYEALMGCARAAEHLDDMVRDKTRKLVFPKDVMIGPSNPYPRPVPPNMAAAPLEENCDRPYAPPETFYLRILTGNGFSTSQRMNAALEYANWLEFKDAHDTARDVYQWAIDIAASAVPAEHLAIDRHTGVLTDLGNTQATPNLLRASTALATHFARQGDVSHALPIYLSALRARRTAPFDPSSLDKHSVRRQDGTDYGRIYNMIRSFIRTAPNPADVPTGDEPLTRPSDAEADCANAELMLYIGEILFATAKSSPEEGLNWTKGAVDIAQRGVQESETQDPTQISKCKDCLQIGVSNWSKMVAKLVSGEAAKEVRQNNSSWSWRSWMPGQAKVGGSRIDWEQESKTVEALRARLIRDGLMEHMAASSGVPGGVWVG